MAEQPYHAFHTPHTAVALLLHSSRTSPRTSPAAAACTHPSRLSHTLPFLIARTVHHSLAAFNTVSAYSVHHPHPHSHSLSAQPTPAFQLHSPSTALILSLPFFLLPSLSSATVPPSIRHAVQSFPLCVSPRCQACCWRLHCSALLRHWQGHRLWGQRTALHSTRTLHPSPLSVGWIDDPLLPRGTLCFVRAESISTLGLTAPQPRNALRATHASTTALTQPHLCCPLNRHPVVLAC